MTERGREIRKITVPDANSNEDFLCCYCGKEVFTRILYCSEKCSDQSELEGIHV